MNFTLILVLLIAVVLATFTQAAGGNYSVANPTQVPLILYYDYFAGRDVGLNSQLVVPGLEVAFGGNPGNEPIGIPGARRSIRLNPGEVTTGNVINYLYSYDYVHIDEISPSQPNCAEDCATVAKNVAAAGMGGRMIFFFRFSYSGSGLSNQRALLQAGMNGWLRKIYFEVYGGDYIYTSTVSSAASKLTSWSNSYHNALSGSNILVAPAIGLRNGGYNDPYLNVCSQDLNALYTIFSNMHQIQVDWKGAAFYGASQTMDVCGYTVPTLVNKVAGLTSWWAYK